MHTVHQPECILLNVLADLDIRQYIDHSKKTSIFAYRTQNIEDALTHPQSPLEETQLLSFGRECLLQRCQK
jgi:hypothetical protein